MDQSIPDWRRNRERGNRSVILFMKWMAVHAPDWVLAPLIRGIALYFTIRTAPDFVAAGPPETLAFENGHLAL
jgi:hypothetical protein